ncbi:hypothetical protein SK128_017351 [Halocaridina rubra]|uniref:Endoglucanase n=1 Tax=Halocaridina rubra TaxID=373956 RepID=A0AAN8XHG8_HALRR
MPYMKEAVKWATDYFIKAHPQPNVFYGQVGEGDLDHAYWGRPEDMTMSRPAFKLTTNKPGSDLAGETSAALAASSILFHDSDPSYAATCLQHAEQLYNFANQYRGKYAQSITDAAKFYNSWGVFDDELAWAAAWLYRATGNRNYLTQAKSHYDNIPKPISEFSWAEKTPGVQVLLAEYADMVDRGTYSNDLKAFCDEIIDKTPTTPKGLVFIMPWGSLRYAANAAFICLRAADLAISPSKYRAFGQHQIHYMLGDGGQSFVVGFGSNPPVRPHHASSSCPSAPAPCDWNTFSSNSPNAHELTGALVGGPDINDHYVDDRTDFISNEVTTDYNAGFQSAVAALRVLANCGNSSNTFAPISTFSAGTTASNIPLTLNPHTSPSTTKAQTSATSVSHIPSTSAGSLVSCRSFLNEKSSWNSGWNGIISIPIQLSVTSWKVDFEFTAPITSFEQWTGTTSAHSSTFFSVLNNSPLLAGNTLTFDFLFRYTAGATTPTIKSINLNEQNICGTGGSTITQAPYTGPGCIATGSTYNYDEVLHKSLLFYEAQRSGTLPSSQRVTWRKDSATGDAIDSDTQQHVDLEGGYYDAGDYVKFGYPMAAMTTVLAWGAIEYGTAYEDAGEMPYMKEAVKWATDYFIKAHPQPNVFYGQVGEGDLDHAYWGRPEDMTMSRPAFKLTTNKPGSDLAGETSAALAASSILFHDSDPSYAATCLQHAEQLYNFANQYRGKYAQSITDAAKFYNSWGVFDDELAWAAAWLYRATGNRNYLTQAKSHYDNIPKPISEFSWAEKTPGVQVLLAEYADMVDRGTYSNDLKAFCDEIIDKTPTTPKGLVFIMPWGSLRYAANAAFICLRAADLAISPSKYRAFGQHQIHYMLGDGGQSFVVGFGSNPPVRPHHASSSCPSAPAPCDWNTFSSNSPNAHELTGALVGGPDINDHYVDDRTDFISNEVTTDYNAGFQSAVAALRVLANCGNSSNTFAPISTFSAGTTASNIPLTLNPHTSPSTTKAQTSATSVSHIPSTSAGNLVSCRSFLNEKSSWNSGWNGIISIPIQLSVTSWKVDFEFTAPITSFEVCTNDIQYNEISMLLDV